MTAQGSSFRRKLMVLSLVSTGATLLVSSLLFTAYAVYNYRRGIRVKLTTEMEIIGATVSPALLRGDQQTATEVLSALRADPLVVASRLFLGSAPFATFVRDGAGPTLPTHPPEVAERFAMAKGTYEITLPVGDGRRPEGSLYVLFDLSDLERRIAGYLKITGGVLAVSLLAALGGAFLLQRQVSDPVLALVATAQRVAAQRDYTLRVATAAKDELATLVESFNSMLDEIEERDRQLRSTNRALRRQTEELGRKSEEVEAFVYIVSHDLRAPLVNLQGFSSELQLSCDQLRQRLAAIGLLPGQQDPIAVLLEEEIPSSLRFISASTTKFERLINALLQLSRSGRRELRPEELDVDALVSSTVDSLRRSLDESGATLIVGALPPAHADATATGQVFSNLLVNAINYLQPGRSGRIEVGGERHGHLNRYFVRDNGVGIAEPALRKLFQVFQRFRPDLAEGEGIGLATVKRIVERHGGSFSVESFEGQGSTFSFTLPAAGAPQEQQHD